MIMLVHLGLKKPVTIISSEVFRRVPRAPAVTLHLKQLHTSGPACAKKKRPQVSVPGAFTPPDPDERLKQLRSGEKT